MPSTDKFSRELHLRGASEMPQLHACQHQLYYSKSAADCTWRVGGFIKPRACSELDHIQATRT